MDIESWIEKNLVFELFVVMLVMSIEVIEYIDVGWELYECFDDFI